MAREWLAANLALRERRDAMDEHKRLVNAFGLTDDQARDVMKDTRPDLAAWRCPEPAEELTFKSTSPWGACADAFRL